MFNLIKVFATMTLCIGLVSSEAGPVVSFVHEVLKQVAVSILSDVIKDVITLRKSTDPPTISASEDDINRAKKIVVALIDTMVPTKERVSNYAARVDYFKSGIVDRSFIVSDQAKYEKRWPIRYYKLLSVDEIAVAPDRAFAIVRYTLEFHVSHKNEVRAGQSKAAIVIGSFNSISRIHAIKEWLH
jgi:hypothetical protein